MPAEEYVSTTTDELAQRIEVAYERFVALARGVGADLRVGEWTSGEVVGHLVTVVNRYNDFDTARLAEAPRGVDEVNRRELSALGAVPMPTLLADLAAEMARFRPRWGAASDLPLDTPLPFHGGSTIDAQSALTNLMGEYLIHGLDIARAAGRGWPIDPRDGALLLAFGTQLLPAYVRPGNTRSALIEFDLDGVAPLVFDVAGPTLAVRAPRPDDEPHVVVTGDPTGVALLFYARASADELDAIGLRVVGGRRPELVSLMSEVFEEP